MTRAYGRIDRIGMLPIGSDNLVRLLILLGGWLFLIVLQNEIDTRSVCC